MVQAISNEQTFVTNLEQFLTKADNFIKIYYSGISEEKQVREIVQELQNLVSDIDLQELEINYLSLPRTYGLIRRLRRFYLVLRRITPIGK